MIGGVIDYIVLTPNKNRIEKFVEVKGYHSKKYYPSKRDLKQFEYGKKLAKEHKTNFEVLIKKPYSKVENYRRE